MADDDDGPRRTKRARSKDQSNPMDFLTEDILLEIFLRLPSLATLIRAALTCRAWRRAVASSPSFRRRFRALKPAPLLGLFIDPDFDDLPVFFPVHHYRNRDVLAAIGRSDFALTPLLDPDDDGQDVPVRWCILDCHGGYLLLMNRDAELLAAVNPLSRNSPRYIDLPRYTEATEPGRVTPTLMEVHLLSSDKDPMSFRLVGLVYDQSRVRAVVFTSDTCHWRFLPWVELAERATPQDAAGDDMAWLSLGLQANGFLYWLFKHTYHVLILDTATMEFTILPFAPKLDDMPGCQVFANGTPDGAPCIVYCTGTTVGMLIYQGAADRWILGRTAQYKKDDNNLSTENNDALKLIALKDGFAYLATSGMVLSLCLETMEFERLFPMSFCAEYVYPYVMAWPPCLVGNYKSFA